MPRWLWWFPLGVLMLVGGLFLFRAGWMMINLSETDVINHYAARYVTEHGGVLTDCVARPGGMRGVWITVECISENSLVSVRYPVDRRGRLVPDVPADAMRPEA